MTNEELRTKIVEILEETEYEWTEEKNGYILQIFYDKLADALIAAGIGDVSEYKEKLKLHRVFVRKDGGDIKVLYGNNEVDEIVKERNEYKHRAEVAERALDKMAEFGYETFAESEMWKEEFIKQAEKELAEEEKE